MPNTYTPIGVRVQWESFKTPLNAANLNNLEDRVEAISNYLSDAQESGAVLGKGTIIGDYNENISPDTYLSIQEEDIAIAKFDSDNIKFFSNSSTNTDLIDISLLLKRITFNADILTHKVIIGTKELTEESLEEMCNSVFIATYGQTKFNDIKKAWNAGKQVILQGSTSEPKAIRNLIHISSGKVFFGRVLAEANLVEEVTVDYLNKWSLINNNYLTKEDLPKTPDLSGYATKEWVRTDVVGYTPKTTTKVFQTTSAGVIRCDINKSYMIYCTGDTQATIRGYGDQNTDSSGNQHEMSGKYLTVYCGGKYDTFNDGQGHTLSNNGAALWYATAMEQGTLTPIGSMNVRRGVVKHPDGDQWAEISYPAGCSIVINETVILADTHVTFTIKGKKYTAPYGTTWEQFANNNPNIVEIYGKEVWGANSAGIIGDSNYKNVKSTDIIIDSENYIYTGA